MRKVHTETYVENDEEVRITTRKRSRWIIHFQPLGIVNSRQPESFDALDCICKFTKAEHFLLQLVKQHKEENNTLTIRPKSYTPAEQAKLKKAIPLWRKKGLLVRIKREYYMVNPWLLPPIDEQLNAMNYWRALKP